MASITPILEHLPVLHRGFIASTLHHTLPQIRQLDLLVPTGGEVMIGRMILPCILIIF